MSKTEIITEIETIVREKLPRLKELKFGLPVTPTDILEALGEARGNDGKVMSISDNGIISKDGEFIGFFTLFRWQDSPTTTLLWILYALKNNK